MRAAIITSHPIQYNAPIFESLSRRNNVEIKVFYTWGESVLKNKFDQGFGKVVEWDIPLLNGYNYEFLENIAEDKGSHHFKGIDNPGIIDAIKKYNPDAIIVFGWAFKSHFKVMRYFKGRIPVFVKGDSTLLGNTGIISKIKRKLFLNFVYRFADYALYVGKNSFDYFKYAGVKPSQLFYVPHVIDNDRFSCNTEDCMILKNAFRASLKINSNDFVFLFAGKFEDNKNPELLMDAFINCDFNDNVHLVLVGNGLLEENLKRKEKPNIHFMDFQNQKSMPAVYAMCDVFVLPSQSETWGLALNEAMAGSKALIASDKCGGAVDLIKEGENGYIFKSNDLNNLKEKMLLLNSQKDKIKIMGEKSRSIIDDFSLENVSEKIEQALLQIKI